MFLTPFRPRLSRPSSSRGSRQERYARPSLEGLEERVNPVTLSVAPQQLLGLVARVTPTRGALPTTASLLARVNRLPGQQLQQLVARIPVATLQQAMNRLPVNQLRQIVALLPQAAINSVFPRLSVATRQQLLLLAASNVVPPSGLPSFPLPLPATGAQLPLGQTVIGLPSQATTNALTPLQAAMLRLQALRVQEVVTRLPAAQLRSLVARLPVVQLQSILARVPTATLQIALNQLNGRLQQTLDTIFQQLGASAPQRLAGAVDVLLGRVPR